MEFFIKHRVLNLFNDITLSVQFQPKTIDTTAFMYGSPKIRVNNPIKLINFKILQ